MDRIAVESRELAIVGYDKATATLEVTFRRGGVYHYFNVPEQTYQELIQSESLGSFFAEKIKDSFEYQKIS